MEETIFTKIARKEIPAYLVDENDRFMAFLDIIPASYGQTLVIPKTWHDSYLFNNNDTFIYEFMSYVKKVAKLLDKKLGSERCRILFEGHGVNHLHAKLYPSFEHNKGGEDFDFRNKAEFNEKIAKEIIQKIKS